MVTVSDKELLEMAQALYKKLGGAGSKDARVVRALIERAGLSSGPTPVAADLPIVCNCTLHPQENTIHAASCPTNPASR